MNDANAEQQVARRPNEWGGDRGRIRRLQVYTRLFAGESPLAILEQEDIAVMQLQKVMSQTRFSTEFEVLMRLAEQGERAVRAQAATACFHRLRELAEQSNETGRKAALDLLALCGPTTRAGRSTRRPVGQGEDVVDPANPPAGPTTDLERQVEALLARVASEEEDHNGANPSGQVEEAEHA